MRVAITLEQCWHRVPGGTAVAALELVEHLIQRDELEVSGIAAAHLRPPPEEYRPPVPIRHHRLPRPVLYEAWHRLGVPRADKRAGNPDVVHATSVITPATSAPLVSTVHDLAFLRHPELLPPRGVRILKEGLEALKRRASLVLCSSSATLEDCAIAGIDRDRLRLVPLGVDIRPVEETEVKAVLANRHLDRPYVLFTGTIEPRKNLRRLLTAFSMLADDIDLVLVGPTGWREVLPDHLLRLGGRADRVHAMGWVPEQELDALYAGAEVFVYPSLMEGFGLPVLEALAHGTPVVTSAGTSTEELIGRAGLAVDPTDTAAIAEAIHTMMTDEELRGAAEASALPRAQQFPWKLTVDKTVAAYREVAA